ncbi:MAG TPA: response regulator, partial [Nitrospiraceae bacterium]
ERNSPVVLIVEDDNDMRSLLCDELWGEGYQLREAKDGDEALQAVLQSIPDLILTDLKMPAGGFDYITRLKTFAPNCPIVLMTAFGGAKTKADALRWGASAYFDKPVRIGDLKEAVRKLLANKLVKEG